MAVLGGFGQESLPELFVFSPFFNACLDSSALVSCLRGFASQTATTGTSVAFSKFRFAAPYLHLC